jgi:methyltransferase (TIGR00027 family)
MDKGDLESTSPDSTAVRVALWRAIHVQVDAPPHVLEDEVGLRLVAPDENWRARPDMHPQGTSRFRASIVARSRFIEDLVAEQLKHGVAQYIILGAGLDTFAQRKPEIASKLTVFEVDQPGTQAWKRRRLTELGMGIPDWLRFVPVNFESKTSLWEQLAKAGFDKRKPTIVSSLGVSMYLTTDAIKDTLRDMAGLASCSKFIMTFMLPLEQVDPEDQLGYQMAAKGARASGTPFISFFTPPEMLTLAREAGFKAAEHLSTASLAPRYFAGRADKLRPSTGEELLIATT